MTNAYKAEVAQRSRELVEDFLRGGTPAGTPAAFLRAVMQHALEKRTGFDWEAAVTFWWDLCRLGAVAIVGGGDATVYSGQPHFIVTERGRRLLAKKDASPHDADRYLEAVRRRVREPDRIAMAYLAEAAGAWRAGLNRSSVVMLGGACERLILLLAQGVRDASLVPYSEKMLKLLSSERPVGIAEVFELARRALVEAAALPGDVADAIDLKLTPIFQRARGLRNEHGHPTGADVTSEDAEAGLLLFPGFYALVDQLDAHLRPGTRS